jgi:iron complex outermembrane receptor protein
MAFGLLGLVPFSLSQNHQTEASQDTSDEVILETVTVTAQKIRDYIENHPQRTISVGSEEIRSRNFLEVSEALANMSGVQVKELGSGGSRISIRGSGGSGDVLVLVNGRPLNSSQYGGVALGSIPIESVERITVFKPPVPVWLGQGAKSGAINIELKSSFQETEEQEDTNRLKLRGGSYGLANADFTRIFPLQSGEVMFSAGAEHEDGKRTNDDHDTARLSLHWDTQTENLTRYEFNGRYYHAERGSPGPIDNPTPDARQDYDKGALDFQYNGLFEQNGDYTWKLYSDLEHLEDTSQSKTEYDLDVAKFGLKEDNTWDWQQGTWALRVGGIIEQNEVDHSATGKHERFESSLYSQIDHHDGDVALSLGLRGDFADDYDLFPAVTTGVSYSLGAKTLLKANAGYVTKIPTFSQLYQPSHGSYDQVRGNPDLSEEEIYSYDLGLEYSWHEETTLELSLFRSDSRDLIKYSRGADLIYRPVNIDHAWRQGIELSLAMTMNKAVSWDIYFLVQDSENKDNDQKLPYTPNYQWKITGKYKMQSGAKLEAILRGEGRQFSQLENKASEELSSYATINGKVIYPLDWQTVSPEVFLHLNNIFDRRYESHHGYPNDGFRFIAGVNVSF